MAEACDRSGDLPQSIDVGSDGANKEPVSKTLEEVNTDALNNIKIGIEKNYLDTLEKARCRVKELVHNQDVLRESIQQEMTNLDEYKLTEDITAFVTELKSYHLKLKNIKKDIQSINDRVGKMKRQASKLKANKEREEKQIEENKRKERELQKHLTAKPAADSISN